MRFLANNLHFIDTEIRSLPFKAILIGNCCFGDLNVFRRSAVDTEITHQLAIPAISTVSLPQNKTEVPIEDVFMMLFFSVPTATPF